MKLNILAVFFLLPLFSQSEPLKISNELVILQKNAKTMEIKLDGIEEQIKSKSLEAASKSVGKHKAFNQSGRASWYGPGFQGRRTANGERFNMNAMTAAHRTLPLGTTVKVTNSANGKSVIVRINDRGPYHGNRVIDLSKAAAQELGFLKQGVAKVNITTIK